MQQVGGVWSKQANTAPGDIANPWWFFLVWFSKELCACSVNSIWVSQIFPLLNYLPSELFVTGKTLLHMIKQITVTIGGDSIAVRLTSCFTCLDMTMQVKIFLIQHKQSSWIQTKYTGGQPYSDTSLKLVFSGLDLCDGCFNWFPSLDKTHSNLPCVRQVFFGPFQWMGRNCKDGGFRAGCDFEGGTLKQNYAFGTLWSDG